MPKRVWILGSGFSRPLNGPTLDSLLRRSSQRVVEKLFPPGSYPELHGDSASQQVYQIYELGHDLADQGHPQMWPDAEAFISVLDAASADPTGHAMAILASVTKLDPVRLAIAARRVVAAECSAFLHQANVAQEPWLPCLHWGSQLTADDTVLSFNYDCVLETLLAQGKPSGLCSEGFVGTAEHRHYTPARQAARVCKVHGSVDWLLHERSGSPQIERGRENAALVCPPHQLLIATPGPKKREMVRGPLSDVWSAAEAALREADAVVFIGYRFPPSDAEARSRVLAAIRENPGYPASLRLYYVLGPSDDEHVRRLHGLLEFAARGRSPMKIPLWAEDFLALYTPDSL